MQDEILEMVENVNNARPFEFSDPPVPGTMFDLACIASGLMATIRTMIEKRASVEKHGWIRCEVKTRREYIELCVSGALTQESGVAKLILLIFEGNAKLFVDYSPEVGQPSTRMYYMWPVAQFNGGWVLNHERATYTFLSQSVDELLSLVASGPSGS